MYPALPGNSPSFSSYGAPSPSGAPGDAPDAHRNAAALSSWGDGTSSVRVKVADEFKLHPPVQLPPAVEAATRPQQAVDFEYERKIMQEQASTSIGSFLSKAEESYYKDTSVAKFLSMGYSVAAVSLGVAYQASVGGDQSQVVDFCNNYTSLLGMGFGPAVAAGALVKTQNDLNAATELCLSAAAGS